MLLVRSCLFNPDTHRVIDLSSCLLNLVPSPNSSVPACERSVTILHHYITHNFINITYYLVSSESIITVGANDIWSDIDIKNADGSITRLQLFPTTNLATGLKDDKKWPGDFDVIKNWPWDGVPPGTSSKSEISVNDNWRIDLQGVSPNGPPGSKKTPGVTWANLQIQLGGKDKLSQGEARNRRNKGLSTSVAEIHAPVGVKFSQKSFQRAFAESQSNTRDGGAQVWMSLIQRKQLSRYKLGLFIFKAMMMTVISFFIQRR